MKKLNRILSGKNFTTENKDYKKNAEVVEEKVGELLTSLGYLWEKDPNMKRTPFRVAKMLLNETMRGTYLPSPKITLFPNDGHYEGVIFEGNIKVKSLCSHHLMPFIGVAHIAYIPLKSSKIFGLSKLNRIVDWFSRRPQLQENLTKQIHDFINEKIGPNLGVAVQIKASHMCVALRGIEDENSKMITAELSGAFLEKDNLARLEFYNFIGQLPSISI